MLGYNIKTAQEIHAPCKLIVRTFPNPSRNKKTRKLHKNVRSDYIPKSTTATEKHQIKQIFSKSLSKQTNESV